MNPNEIQHGGDHYMKAGDRQHWDMVAALGGGWEYYIGAATAYLTRIKQPDLDPPKAGHFIDKLIWLIENGVVPERWVSTQGTRDVEGGKVPYNARVSVEQYLVDYNEANGITGTPEAAVILRLMTACDINDLRDARAMITAIEPKPQPAKSKAEVKKADHAAQFATGYVVGEAVSFTGSLTASGVAVTDGDPGKWAFDTDGQRVRNPAPAPASDANAPAPSPAPTEAPKARSKRN